MDDDERQIMQGTGQGLLEFLDNKGQRGELNKTTAKAFRNTSAKILEVESPDLANIDVRQVNVAELLERFANLRRADYGEESLQTYRSRFRRSVAMYLAWLDGDANWKTAGLTPVAAKQASRSNAGRARTRKTTSKARPTDAGSTVEAPKDELPAEAGVRLMTYDVPLRRNLIVKVTLPLDLTAEDADRLSKFVSVLAFSNPAGSETHSS